MTTTTLTLTDFLLARIAEDEERVDRIPEWYCTDSARGDGWGSRGDCPLCGKHMWDGTESVTEDAFWEHMEDAHLRTRVLAECEAKRRIVQRYVTYRDHHSAEQSDFDAGVGIASALDIQDLGTVYADHPDYRDEWRP